MSYGFPLQVVVVTSEQILNFDSQFHNLHTVFEGKLLDYDITRHSLLFELQSGQHLSVSFLPTFSFSHLRALLYCTSLQLSSTDNHQIVQKRVQLSIRLIRNIYPREGPAPYRTERHCQPVRCSYFEGAYYCVCVLVLLLLLLLLYMYVYIYIYTYIHIYIYTERGREGEMERET
jgi:hypothetical protein